MKILISWFLRPIADVFGIAAKWVESIVTNVQSNAAEDFAATGIEWNDEVPECTSEHQQLGIWGWGFDKSVTTLKH